MLLEQNTLKIGFKIMWPFVACLTSEHGPYVHGQRYKAIIFIEFVWWN